MQRDKVLALQILRSIDEKDWIGDDSEWSAGLFLSSKYNTSGGDMVSISFQYALLKHHGCFMVCDQVDPKTERCYEDHLSWRGFDLLESLALELRESQATH